VTDEELRRLFEETRQRIDSSASETRRYVDQKSAETRQQIDSSASETRAYVDQKSAETRQQIDSSASETRGYVDQQFAEARQEIGSSASETRRYVDQKFAEVRQQFDVHAEDVRARFELAAEGLQSLNEKLVRETNDIRAEMHRGFAETQAMIKFSHSELDRRVVALEDDKSSKR
jgi:hypothetical protein